jgi:CHAT domain-containing protein
LGQSTITKKRASNNSLLETGKEDLKMEIITLQRVPQTAQQSTTSQLMLEIWSRAQTRIIQDLNNQAHRGRTHTWETIQHDTAKINLLNRLSTVIMQGIVAVNHEKLNKITTRNEEKLNRTQEENRIPAQTSTQRITLKPSVTSARNQGNQPTFICNLTAVRTMATPMKAKHSITTNLNRPFTRSQRK